MTKKLALSQKIAWTGVFSILFAAFSAVAIVARPTALSVGAETVAGEISTLCANYTPNGAKEFDISETDSLQLGKEYFTLSATGADADIDALCDGSNGAAGDGLTFSGTTKELTLRLSGAVFPSGGTIRSIHAFFNQPSITADWYVGDENGTSFRKFAQTKTGDAASTYSYHTVSAEENSSLHSVYYVKAVFTCSGSFVLQELDIDFYAEPTAIRVRKDAALSDISTNELFTDWMILQQGVKINVWGFGGGADGNEVEITVGGQRKIAVVHDYAWNTQLDPLPVGTDYTLTMRGETNTLTVKNVAVGEVYIAAGQSNMQRTVSTLDGASDSDYIPNWGTEQIRYLKNNPNKNLRLFNQGHTSNRRSDVKTLDSKGWAYADFDTAYKFSALGFFFGEKLQQEFDVPVGIIYAAVGGTRIQLWTSGKQLEEWTGEGESERVRSLMANEKEEYDMFMSGDSFTASTAHPSVSSRKISSASLYYGMVKPLAPYNVRSVLWYQGCSNAANDYEFYHVFMKLMTEGWREDFGDPDLPFLAVELAPCTTAPGGSVRSNYKLAPVQSEMMYYLDNVYTTTVSDIPKEEGNYNIHPQDKVSMARRLLLLARQYVYGEDVVGAAPMLQNIEWDDDTAFVNFQNVGKGLTTLDGGDEVVGFKVSANGSKWVEAEALLYDKDTVMVWANSLSEIRYLAYNYTEGFTGNLCNSAGIPAGVVYTPSLLYAADEVRTIDRKNYLPTIQLQENMFGVSLPACVQAIIGGRECEVAVQWEEFDPTAMEKGVYTVKGISTDGNHFIATAVVEVNGKTLSPVLFYGLGAAAVAIVGAGVCFTVLFIKKKKMKIKEANNA